MARRPASRLSIRLTRSHLEGIGRVAATWSLLEFAIISAISEVSGIKIFKTIILVGPSAFASWVDMLMVMNSNPQNNDELEALTGLLIKLQRFRNYIVHATWESPKQPGSGLIGKAMNPLVVGAYDKASAIGIPKRGRDIIVQVQWTPKQMRHVAALIEESQSILSSIVYWTPPTSPQTRILNALLYRSNLPRIRQMLDSLPDPFQKKSKKQRAP